MEHPLPVGEHEICPHCLEYKFSWEELRVKLGDMKIGWIACPLCREMIKVKRIVVRSERYELFQKGEI